jgi:hypothetical protein
MDEFKFKSLVIAKIGAASMAWSEFPTGEYRDDIALKYVDEIIEAAKHPTCKTCIYHVASKIGERTCQRHSIEVHGDGFYCADHEEAGE